MKSIFSKVSKKPDYQSLLLELTKTPNSQISSVEELLKQGANPYLKDEKKKSAFNYATEQSNLELMYKIYQHKEFKTPKIDREALILLSLDQLDKAQQDPTSLEHFINFSATSKLQEVNDKALFTLTSLPMTNLKQLNILLENGADPNIEYDGITAFHQALKANNLEAMHSMYQHVPSLDYKDLLERHTIATLTQAKDDVSEFNKILKYSERSNLPQIKKEAELIMYREGVHIIPPEVTSIEINGQKTIIQQDKKTIATPEMISAFAEFIKKGPLLGSNITEDNEQSFAKTAVDFALNHFKSNPELLDNVITLITEQNPNDKKLTQELTDRLIQHSNDNISSLTQILKMDSLIKITGGKINNYKFGSLSQSDTDNLFVIASLLKHRKDQESMISGDITEKDLTNFHQAVQSIQDKDIPQSLGSRINSAISYSTQTFFDKQIRLGDANAISRMSEIAANTKTFMAFTFETPETQNKDTLEEQTINKLIESILGTDLENLDKAKLDKLGILLDQKPSLGDFSNQRSLGRIALDIAITYAKDNPENLEKITSLIIERQTNNELSSYEKALSILGNKTEHLSRTELDNFVKFLQQDPLPYMGDHRNEKTLANLTLKIIENHPDRKEQLSENYLNLSEKGPDLLINATSLIIEAANSSQDKEQREVLTEHIISHLKPQISFENPKDTEYLMLKTAKAEHNKLLNTIILENKGNIDSKLDYYGIESLFKEGYKDAVKELLFDSKAISHYISEAYGKPEVNNELIKFIFDNSNDKSILLSENTIDVLVNTAVKQQDSTMLNKIITEATNTGEQNLISFTTEQIIKKADPAKLNDFVTNIFSDPNYETEKKSSIAISILQKDETITKLDANSVNSLASSYNPSTDSPKFLHKLMDVNYSKNDSKQSFVTKLSLARITNIKDTDAFRDSFNSYFETKQYHDKKPLMTWVKSIFSGKTPQKYKEDQITESVSKVKTKLESCLTPRDIKLPQQLEATINAQQAPLKEVITAIKGIGAITEAREATNSQEIATKNTVSEIDKANKQALQLKLPMLLKVISERRIYQKKQQATLPKGHIRAQ